MLAYISQTTMSARDFMSLLRLSQAKNSVCDVTGVLMMRGTTLFQILEGPKDTVRDLYQTIGADRRHSNVYTLINEPIAKRRFSVWPMEGFCAPALPSDVLGVFHDLGDHFREEGQYSPTSMYSYCWKMIAQLAPYRVQEEVFA